LSAAPRDFHLAHRAPAAPVGIMGGRRAQRHGAPIYRGLRGLIALALGAAPPSGEGSFVGSVTD